jgi:hypothetical protein
MIKYYQPLDEVITTPPPVHHPFITTPTNIQYHSLTSGKYTVIKLRERRGKYIELRMLLKQDKLHISISSTACHVKGAKHKVDILDGNILSSMVLRHLQDDDGTEIVNAIEMLVGNYYRHNFSLTNQQVSDEVITTITTDLPHILSLNSSSKMCEDVDNISCSVPKGDGRSMVTYWW